MDLPVRIAELGNMHRWEKSGQVTGMSRVRIMTLNDAHIFCVEDQIQDEAQTFIDLLHKVGAEVRVGEPLYVIYANSDTGLGFARELNSDLDLARLSERLVARVVAKEAWLEEAKALARAIAEQGRRNG